jgi:4-aminobutyrate aminotransferase
MMLLRQRFAPTARGSGPHALFVRGATSTAQPNLNHLKAEGDINLSPRRARYAARNTETSAQTTALLAEDARVFLHQSLSTPCINALRKSDGIHIEDLEGRRFMDFHGNSVVSSTHSLHSLLESARP